MIRLPDTIRNPVSLVGVALATAAAAFFLVLLLLESFGFLANPYLGLLLFVSLPLIFIAALVLIPIGAWRAARRRRLRPGAPEWPVIDLGQPRQRTIFGGVLVLTFVNVVIVSIAGYGGVHYMESTEFCGQVCHETMAPEFEAHQAWPHARVACTACHIGPGVDSFVEAKLAGTRQLYHLVTGQVPKPVPTPVRSLGRTGDTCEGCHALASLAGRTLREVRDYAEDEASTESVTALLMKVGSPSGGPGSGIHRHVGLDIEYVTTDERRESIPFVRVRDEEGQVREFTAKGATSAQIAGGTRRRMDCTDCHNRPAHTFAFTPQRAVDQAMANGALPRGLPFIRREVVAAVSADYPDRASALEAIAARLGEFYRSRPEVDARRTRQAVAAAQDVWARNVFPPMNVTWGSYPNHRGHVDTPGCFRCHDDTHRSPDGAVISQDCELCHAFQ
jgi:nitrate/TMAO reductase-like tetraheme cytochrome c subunit